jgi:cytochrome c biogenesis protein CcdA
MNIGILLLALLSGALSTLSPCVLPLLPIVIATAVQSHRWGAVALGLGLTLSFTVIGLFIATIGFSLGISAEVLRRAAGFLLLGFGLILVIPGLQQRFVALVGSVSGGGVSFSAKVDGEGLGGQFLVGLVLGAVWSPCAGPTLGAAATLAGSGQGFAQAAGIMLVYGLGAVLPLALIGSLSRPRLNALRQRLLAVASGGKLVLGALFLLIGAGIVSGYDHRLESWLVDASPDWLTDLTTRF